MPKSEVQIDSGICGFKTTITAESEDGLTAKIEIKSDCPEIMHYGSILDEVNAMEDVFAPFGEASVYRAAKDRVRHSACPVPAGVLKAVEVACSLALPKDVHITVEKKD